MSLKKIRKIKHALQRQLGSLPELLSISGGSHKSGKPFLVERNGILTLHFEATTIQSEMAIDAPDELVICYTRSMMSFLLLRPSPARITMIGLGGGSLAKYCYRHLPECEITVLEIDPDVIALRNEFAIPANSYRFMILACDGASWIKNPAYKPEVLIVDGYDAVGLPEQLSSPEFYDDCYAHLADDGILVVNLWGSNANYSTYLTRIHHCFDGHVVVLDASDSVNKIVLAVKNEAAFLSHSAIYHHADLLNLSHPLDFNAKSAALIKALK